MTFKEFFSFRANPMLWWNIIGFGVVIVLLVVGAWFGLKYYTKHGEAIEVPSAKGLSPEEAAKRMWHQGLIAIVTDSMHVKEMRLGDVISQKPEAGELVKSQRIVRLTINSRSVPTLPMPDIADNSSLRQAIAKLTSAGFRLSAEEYTRGDKNWVYDVKMNGRSLSRGEPIPIGATLTLVVGDGYGSAPENDFDRIFDDIDAAFDALFINESTTEQPIQELIGQPAQESIVQPTTASTPSSTSGESSIGNENAH